MTYLSQISPGCDSSRHWETLYTLSCHKCYTCSLLQTVTIIYGVITNGIKMVLLFQECSCWNRQTYHISHLSGAFGVLTGASLGPREYNILLWTYNLQVVYHHIVN